MLHNEFVRHYDEQTTSGVARHQCLPNSQYKFYADWLAKLWFESNNLPIEFSGFQFIVQLCIKFQYQHLSDS